MKCKWPVLIARLAAWSRPHTGCTLSGQLIRDDVRRLLAYVAELEARIDDEV